MGLGILVGLVVLSSWAKEGLLHLPRRASQWGDVAVSTVDEACFIPVYTLLHSFIDIFSPQ